jgi:hypothetical protein
MTDEPKTDKPDQRRFSYATGCLLGFSFGILGVMLGQYLGAHTHRELQAQIQAQTADILRAKGRTVDPSELPQPFVYVGGLFGGLLGWPFGWLLAAFIPSRRTTTGRDYLLVAVIGLLPICLLQAAILCRHLLR